MMMRSTTRSSAMSFWGAVLMLFCSVPVFAQTPWQGLLGTSRATDWRGVGAAIPTGTIPDCPTQPATPVTFATINAAIAANYGGASYCKINIPAGTYTASDVNTLSHHSGDFVNGMITITPPLNSSTAFATPPTGNGGVANIVLNGAGPNLTTFVWTGADTGADRCNWGPSYHIDVCIFNGVNSANGGYTASYGRTAYGSYQGNLVAITGGSSAGSPIAQNSNQITLASLSDSNNPNPSTLMQGQIIQIEQMDPATDNGNAWFCGVPWFDGNGNDQTPPGYSRCSWEGDTHSPFPPQGPSSQNQTFIVTACGAAGYGQPCTSNTITLNTPIRAANWSLSQTPQAAWQSAMPISNVGFQNISIDTSTAQDQPIIMSCSECSNVWFSNVRSISGTTQGVSATNHYLIGSSDHVTIQNSYMYGSNPAADGYGIDFLWGTSDSLALNNITQHMASGLINETSVGNVFAYNYSVDAYFGSNWQSCTEFEHGAADSELLYEGNIGICHSADDIHGNHAWNTIYRDYLSGFDPSNFPDTGPRQLDTFAFIDEAGSRYYNVVGNVFGTAGTTLHYQNADGKELPNCGPGFPQFTVYSLNFGNGNQVPFAEQCVDLGSPYTWTIDNDPLVENTLVRWANYDVVNGSVQENASETGSSAPDFPGLASPATTFPASFFLSAKPSWWVFPNGAANTPWPGIGPDVTGGNIAGVGGYAWLNPAANCYINVMGGSDGSNGVSNVQLFDPVACYSSSTISQVATPTFTPQGGTYTAPQSVTISDSTANSTIYYTLDGSTPTTSSTVYTSPVTVSTSETLQVIATAPGDLQSAVGSASYVISLPTTATPTFSPAAGTYSSAQSVTISESTPGATIYYTTDGSTPTTSSAIYEAPITVANSLSLHAMATSTADLPSAVGAAVYTISSATPSITYVQGAQLPYLTSSWSTPCAQGASGATCDPITLTTPTAAGDLLVVLASNTGFEGAETNIGSIACADGSGNAVTCNWVQPGAVCQNFNSNGGGGVDCAYILASPAGIKTVTITMSGTTKYSTAYFREYNTTQPTGFRFDNVATAISNSCDSCSTPSLTLSGTNDAVIALGAPQNEFTAMSAPYGDFQTETSITGSIVGDLLNTSTGPGAMVSGNGAGGAATLLTLAFTDTPAPPAPAATPTFSVAGGTYTSWQNVKISSTTTGATVYYTTDGSSPTTNSPVYSRPLNISASTTLQAIAVSSSSSPSTVASTTYTINIAPTPMFGPSAGQYSQGQIISIGDSNPNATIYYTTDGTTPTTGSTQYGTPFLVPAPGTSTPATVIVQAIATVPGYGTSPVSSAVYTIGGTGTISLIQQSVLTNNGQQITCSPTCPAFSINPTGAGDLLFVAAVGTGDGHNNQSNIGSISCANASGPASCGTWVQPGAPVCQAWNSNGGGVDCGYVLSASAGITSVTVTMSTYTPYGTVYFREYKTTEPSGFRFDAGATAFNSAGCDSCVTPTLTLNDANDVVIATGAPQSSFTGIDAPYGDAETEPFTLSVIGDVVNTPSGAGAALTGNGTSNNQATLMTIAFTDTPPVTATPTILPAAGTYTSVQSATITDSTPGAVIYYTTDNSTPTTSSTAYSGAITVSASKTINAIALALGSTASDVASASYVINLPPATTPTFSPAAGTYDSAPSVTISDTTAGATIYYTIDGSTPTTSSSVFSTPITVSSNETINAIAVAFGYTQSAVGSAAYVIGSPVPVISGISPAFTTAGTTGLTLTVSGNAFTSNSVVYWGSTALTTQFTSATQLTAQLPASATAIAGITSVTVQTPSPGGGTSNTFSFEVDTAPTTPPNFTTTSATVTAGSTAVFPVTLPGNVTQAYVACFNLPAGGQCSYSSTNGAVSIGTTSATPTGTYQVTVVFYETVTGASTALVLFPLLLIPVYCARTKLKRSTGWMIVGLVAILCTGMLMTGCGGSPNGTGGTTTETGSGVVTLTVQ